MCQCQAPCVFPAVVVKTANAPRQPTIAKQKQKRERGNKRGPCRCRVIKKAPNVPKCPESQNLDSVCLKEKKKDKKSRGQCNTLCVCVSDANRNSKSKTARGKAIIKQRKSQRTAAQRSACSAVPVLLQLGAKGPRRGGGAQGTRQGVEPALWPAWTANTRRTSRASAMAKVRHALGRQGAYQRGRRRRRGFDVVVVVAVIVERLVSRTGKRAACEGPDNVTLADGTGSPSRCQPRRSR